MLLSGDTDRCNILEQPELLEQTVEGSDLVVAATDSEATKLQINQECWARGVPAVYGAAYTGLAFVLGSAGIAILTQRVRGWWPAVPGAVGGVWHGALRASHRVLLELRGLLPEVEFVPRSVP